jgi:serine/threonine protein phosphatase PrpC
LRLPFGSGPPIIPEVTFGAPDGDRLRLRFTAESHIGRRSSNQDAVDAGGVGRFQYWAVADGLGAHRGGAAAARLAVATATAELSSRPSVDPSVVERVVESANAALLAERASPTGGGLTTLVVLITDGATATWAHVGDSRIYLFRAGGVERRTRDHSVPEMLFQAREIAEDEIRGHRDRNRLLRALGQRAEARPTVSEPVTLKHGDAFLLCTDGWWESLHEVEMLRLLGGSPSPEDWLAAMIAAIEPRAPADNFTATAIYVG